MHQKWIPDHYLIFVNIKKQSIHSGNFFKQKFFEGALSKIQKNLTSFYVFELSFFQ